MTVVGICFLLVLAVPAWAQPAIPPNTWVQLSPVHETNARTFGGAAWDSVRHKVLHFGGGDPGYWGNQIASYDPVTNDWTDDYTPEPIATYEGVYPGASCMIEAECPGTGIPTNKCAGGACRNCIVGEPPEIWNAITPLGRPWVAHVEDFLTFDTTRGRLFMLGGAGGKRCLHSTSTVWEYDPSAASWLNKSQPNGSPPGQCTAGAAVYDADADRVIVRCGSFANTWIYNPGANTWLDANPPTSPAIRASFSMEYDRVNRRVVLFGGVKSGVVYGDTWAYDVAANTWTNMNPPTTPSPRLGAGMVYDTAHEVLILWGGKDLNAQLADTWTYRYASNTWTQLAPAAAPPPFTPRGAMVYDAADDMVILMTFVTALYAPDAPTGGMTTTWGFRYAPSSVPPGTPVPPVLL